MATGDAATAAGMDILTGFELADTLDTEENKTRDYIAQYAAGTRPVEQGGTGATTPLGARQNLGVQTTVDAVANATAAGDTGTPAGNKLVKYNEAGRIGVNTPTSDGQAVNKGYCDGNRGTNGVPASGGTFTGNVYFPNAVPASSSYSVAYLNGDGRLSRGASSERYKDHITEIDPADLGDIWPTLHTFQMIGGDGTTKVGYIAERLHENPDQQPFVVYSALPDSDPVPESIDFIALLMAQNAQLHQAVELLAQRLDALETPADVETPEVE